MNKKNSNLDEHKEIEEVYNEEEMDRTYEEKKGEYVESSLTELESLLGKTRDRWGEEEERVLIDIISCLDNSIKALVSAR